MSKSRSRPRRGGDDLPSFDQVPDPPAAIRRLSDPPLRERAEEAWAAACRLIAALDTAADWFTHLWYTRDEDPGVITRCLDTAQRSVKVLFAAGVRAEPFDRLEESEVLAMLPPWPGSSPGGTSYRWDSVTQQLVEYEEPRWEDDQRLWDQWHGASIGRGRQHLSNTLRGHAHQLRKALREYPATVLTGRGPTGPQITRERPVDPGRGGGRATAHSAARGGRAQKTLSPAEEEAARRWKENRGAFRSYKELAAALTQEGYKITAKAIARVVNRLQQRESRDRRRRHSAG